MRATEALSIRPHAPLRADRIVRVTVENSTVHGTLPVAQSDLRCMVTTIHYSSFSFPWGPEDIGSGWGSGPAGVLAATDGRLTRAHPGTAGGVRRVCVQPCWRGSKERVSVAYSHSAAERGFIWGVMAVSLEPNLLPGDPLDMEGFEPEAFSMSASEVWDFTVSAD